jgi:multidrug resistance efflux pump
MSGPGRPAGERASNDGDKGGCGGLLSYPRLVIGGVLLVVAVSFGVLLWWLNAANEAIATAQAALDKDDAALSYTQLFAPVDGRVSAIGDSVPPGTQMMATVPPTARVAANVKETQLKPMRPGQSVVTKVDACTEDHLHGDVSAVQQRAGRQDSLTMAGAPAGGIRGRSSE